MTTGLYVGRFQPFHLGHLEAVKHILTKVDELVIVVGSAHDSHTVENPFTAGERITMIRLALKEAKIDANRYTVLPLPDAEFHKVWVSHLLSQTPSFDLVFTNEPLTGRLLKEAGMRVEKIPMFNRTSFTATEVRKRIIEGRIWEELLPKSVSAYVKQIKGEERMREIAQTDKVN
ncbi:MAG: nicotinamide-nucleotide adenylyltransferase [Crenarchaeota archaeon 13_1_40CM_2_52_14]|nr:MAG: nicotinamide-nucleotide adenylyltransferase [Crenarchaeota archaeon 13_1_40CM_3_52_17]OLD34160.1 MAG: nicotinamide-nucleotide adenylyltransferase [Crenarchaeota archaeon 13_1_40CM_2_52_14]